jgi:exosortase
MLSATATDSTPMPESAGDGRLEVSPRTALLAGVAIVALFVGVYWDWFLKQARFAIDFPADWGHTILIPGIAGWFVWLKRDRLLSEPVRPAWEGLLVLVLGLAGYALCTLGPASLHHHNIRGLTVGLTFFGLVLLVLGWRWMRWLWFPIVYVVAFGQTVSERFMSLVTYRLQDISAKGAYVLLSLFGMDVDLSGNVLTVHSGGTPHMLNVAEACSGMRMLVAFLALGVAMAYVSLPMTWQRITLVVMGVPVAVFVNVLRVTSLGLLTLIDGEFAAGEFHHFIGLLWLVPAFLLYLLVLWVLGKLVVPDSPEAGHAR